jgi:predicted  nucleic acid-binding Zn-ribbon protein
LFEDLKKSDAVVTCENCRRILYFEVVIDVEGTMNV